MQAFWNGAECNPVRRATCYSTSNLPIFHHTQRTGAFTILLFDPLISLCVWGHTLTLVRLQDRVDELLHGAPASAAAAPASCVPVASHSPTPGAP